MAPSAIGEPDFTELNSQATSNDVRADHEKLVRIYTFPRPHEIFPPAFPLTRLLGDVIAAGRNVT